VGQSYLAFARVGNIIYVFKGHPSWGFGGPIAEIHEITIDAGSQSGV